MSNPVMPRKRDEDCLVERLDGLGILAQRKFSLSRIAAASVASPPFLETGSDIERPSRFFLLVTCLQRKGKRKCLFHAQFL
jgi:hypothetical protein